MSFQKMYGLRGPWGRTAVLQLTHELRPKWEKKKRRAKMPFLGRTLGRGPTNRFSEKASLISFSVLFCISLFFLSCVLCSAKCFLLHTYSVHLFCLFISLPVLQYMCLAFFNSLLLLSRLLFNQRLNFSWQCCHPQCRVCGPRTGDRGHERVAEIGKVRTQTQTQK